MKFLVISIMVVDTRSTKVKSESTSTVEPDKILSETQLVEDSDEDPKEQSNDIVQHTLEKWDAYREYEQQQLESIKFPRLKG